MKSYIFIINICIVFIFLLSAVFISCILILAIAVWFARKIFVSQYYVTFGILKKNCAFWTFLNEEFFRHMTIRPDIRWDPSALQIEHGKNGPSRQQRWQVAILSNWGIQLSSLSSFLFINIEKIDILLKHLKTLS